MEKNETTFDFDTNVVRVAKKIDAHIFRSVLIVHVLKSEVHDGCEMEHTFFKVLPN